MKVRELIKMIERDGWTQARTRGSHRRFARSVEPGTVAASDQAGTGVPPATLNGVLEQADPKQPESTP